MTTTQDLSAAIASAMELHRRGDHSEAEQIYREIIDADPRQADAWHLLGFLAFQTSRFELADRCLTQAIAICPEAGEFHNNLALTRLARRQIESADRHAARACRLGYMDAAGYLHLGFELYRYGDFETAEACLQLAIRIEPHSADGYNYLGVVYKARSEFQEAIACYERALQLQPEHVAALNNLGNAWRDQGEAAKAMPFYEQALHIDPSFVAAHNNLGVAAAYEGDLELAISCYQQACRLDPKYTEAHNNLGNALRDQGRYDQSADCYQTALKIDPSSAEIRNNLGVTLRCQGELTAAIDNFRQALSQQPDSVNTLVNLASALIDQGEFGEAAGRYRQIAAVHPDQPLWKLRVAAICPTVFPHREAMDNYWEKLQCAIGELEDTEYPIDADEFLRTAPQAPFNLQFYATNLVDIKKKYASIFGSQLRERFSREVCPIDLARLWAQRPHVGLVVSSEHEGLFLKSLRGVLERIDTDQFRISIFCASSGHHLIRSALPNDHIHVVPLPNRFVQAAQMLRDQQCHLLYYWEVGTSAANYFLPFFRLAPIQCTSWGIQVTTGIPDMDFYVSNDLVEPADAQAHYSERLILARTLLCYRQRAVLNDSSVSRDSWGFREKDRLYVCAHQLGKYHPDFDDILADILRRDRAGKILAIEDRFGRHVQTLRARLSSSIPDVAQRILFLPRLDRRKYLSLIATADVLLDPPHFGGVNTTYDGLSLNQPIVTLPSPYHRGRYTLGCYRKMSVDACVANDAAQYAQIAVRLASEPDYRHEVVTQLNEASPVLFEDIQAVREHERIFSELIEAARMQ